MARQVHPDDDAWDDGGAPDWRRRQIEMRPKSPWRRANPLGLFFLAYLAPFVLIGSVGALGVAYLLIRDSLR